MSNISKVFSAELDGIDAKRLNRKVLLIIALILTLFFLNSLNNKVLAASVSQSNISVRCRTSIENFSGALRKLRLVGANATGGGWVNFNYDGQNLSKINAFVDALYEVCEENFDDIKEVFIEKAISSIKTTGRVTFESADYSAYPGKGEADLINHRTDWKFCSYSDFERIGNWIITGGYHRKNFCLPDLYTYSFGLSLIVLLLAAFFYDRRDKKVGLAAVKTSYNILAIYAFVLTVLQIITVIINDIYNRIRFPRTQFVSFWNEAISFFGGGASDYSNVGFIVTFIAPAQIIIIVLSIKCLFQVKKTGQKGKLTAVAALVINILFILVLSAIIFLQNLVLSQIGF